MRRAVLLVAAVWLAVLLSGCVYANATWNLKNGKMYVTKNALGGLLRAVYECTPAGTSFNCQQLPDAP